MLFCVVFLPRVYAADVLVGRTNHRVDPKVRKLHTLVIYTARRTIREPWDQRQKDKISNFAPSATTMGGPAGFVAKAGQATGLTFMNENFIPTMVKETQGKRSRTRQTEQ